MKQMEHWLLTGVVVVLAVAATGADVVPDQRSITEAESRCLENRRMITSGHLTITNTARRASGQVTGMNVYWIDFEGTNLRFDYHIGQSPGGEGGHKSRNVVTDTAIWIHADQQSVGFNTAVVKLLPDSSNRAPIFHPRLLGMTVSPPSFLHSMENLESFIGRTDGRTIKVGPAVVDGIEADFVECLQGSGIEQRMWFAPGQGGQMIKSETEYETQGGRLRGVARADFARHDTPSGTVWYPKSIRFERFFDDELKEVDETVVTDAKFNEDIDDSRFRLESMDIPAGTPVMSEFGNDGVTKEWTGEKLVGIGSLGDPPKGLVEGGEESRRATMLIISVNLALLSGAFLWAYLRSKRRARSQHPS